MGELSFAHPAVFLLSFKATTMSNEVFLDFGGWIRVNPETNMQCTSEDESLPAIIKVKDWAKLSAEDRQHYILEDAIAAIRDAEDLEYTTLDLSFGEEDDTNNDGTDT